jgi:hypothetical protein
LQISTSFFSVVAGYELFFSISHHRAFKIVPLEDVPSVSDPVALLVNEWWDSA